MTTLQSVDELAAEIRSAAATSPSDVDALASEIKAAMSPDDLAAEIRSALTPAPPTPAPAPAATPESSEPAPPTVPATIAKRPPIAAKFGAITPAIASRLLEARAADPSDLEGFVVPPPVAQPVGIAGRLPRPSRELQIVRGEALGDDPDTFLEGVRMGFTKASLQLRTATQAVADAARARPKTAAAVSLFFPPAYAAVSSALAVTEAAGPEEFRERTEQQRTITRGRHPASGTAWAGLFVADMLNPIYLGAFGLGSGTVRAGLAAIARVPGVRQGSAAVIRNTLGKAIGQRNAEKFMALLAKVGLEEGMGGGAGIGAISGVDQFAAEGSMEGVIQAAAEGTKLGIPMSILFGRAIATMNRAGRGFVRTTKTAEARTRLGLPEKGDITQAQVDAAWERTARATAPDFGGTPEAFLQAKQAHEFLTYELNPELGAVAALARTPNPADLADDLARRNPAPPEVNQPTRVQQVMETAAEGKPAFVKDTPLQPAKAAWQMTRSEAEKELRFVGTRGVQIQGQPTARQGVVRMPDGTDMHVPSTDPQRAVLQAYRRSVEEAAARGEPVPELVRAGFPDIKFSRPGPPAVVTPEFESEFVSVRRRNRQQRRGLVLLPPSPRPLIQRAKRGLGSFFLDTDRILTPAKMTRGGLPASAFDAKIRLSGRIGAQVLKVNNTLEDFNRALRAELGRRPTDAELAVYTDILHGNRGLAAAPPGLRPVLNRMRNEVDFLSQVLIDEGVVQGDLALVVDANRGVYLNRAYRAISDPKFAKKRAKRIEKLEDLATAPRGIDQQMWNKIIAWARSEYAGATDTEIQALLGELVAEAGKKGNLFDLVRSAGLSPKNTGILKQLKDVPEELRALLGEFKDPREQYANTVMKQASLINSLRFLREVREAGLQGGWLKRESPTTGRAPVPGWERIEASVSSPANPLNGLYTDPAINKAFRRQFNRGFGDGLGGDLLRLYMVGNTAVKIGKTAYNPASHPRNFFSNPFFALSQGHISPSSWKKSMGALMEEVGMTDIARTLHLPAADPRVQNARRAFIREARLYGVTHESTRAGELFDMIRDARQMPVSDFVVSRARLLARKGFRAPLTAYRLEDEFWKLVGWHQEIRAYSKAFPNWTPQEVKAHAAKIIRMTYPTYSLVPPFIKAIRRFPVFGSFVSFTAESVRVSGNTVRLITSELANPATRAIGARRMAGSLATVSALGGLAVAGHGLFGWTRDQTRDLRRFVAPWDENAVIIPWTAKNGNPRYINLSWTNPYDQLQAPLLAALRGESWEDKLRGTVVEALRPYYEPEILAEAINGIFNNRTRFGSRLWNPEDDGLNIASAMALRLMEAAEPGVVRSFRRNVAANFNNPDTTAGQRLNPRFEALATAGGRITEVNVPLQLQFNTIDNMRRWKNARSLLSRELGNPEIGNMTKEGVQAAYRRADEVRREVIRDVIADHKAAIRIHPNIDDRRALNIMRAGGATGEVVLMVRTGVYKPMLPTADILRDMLETANALNPGVNIMPELQRRIAILREVVEEERHRARTQAPEP